MRPNLHPRLVNGRFGDPGPVRRDAAPRAVRSSSTRPILRPLSARNLLRVTHVLVTHARGSVIGLDQLLRLQVAAVELGGRTRRARFHFSLRHEDEEAGMLAEVAAAFGAREA